MIEGHKRSVNNCIESMMQLMVRIEEENKNTCQKLTTNAKEHKIKLINLETKCELLEMQVKTLLESKKSEKPTDLRIKPSNKEVPQTRPAVPIEQVEQVKGTSARLICNSEASFCVTPRTFAL